MRYDHFVCPACGCRNTAIANYCKACGYPLRDPTLSRMRALSRNWEVSQVGTVDNTSKPEIIRNGGPMVEVRYRLAGPASADEASDILGGYAPPSLPWPGPPYLRRTRVSVRRIKGERLWEGTVEYGGIPVEVGPFACPPVRGNGSSPERDRSMAWELRGAIVLVSGMALVAGAMALALFARVVYVAWGLEGG